MKTIIDQVKTFFSKETAVQVAAGMNADPDDNWLYVAVHDPHGTGYSFINVYNENGELISYL